MEALKEILKEYSPLGKYFLRVFTVLVQLGCGLWATSWSAFFNKKEVDVWAYLIFTVYLIFALCLLCNIGREIHLCLKPEPVSLEGTIFPLPISNSYLLSLCVTTWLLVIVMIYNGEVLGHPPSNTVINYPLAIFSPTLLGWRLFFPRDFRLIPCGFFIPWVDMGCGLAITAWTAFFNDNPVGVWAYLIFGGECIFAGWLGFFQVKDLWKRLSLNGYQLRKIYVHSPVVDIGAIGTTICFCVVCFYNVVGLGHDNMFTVPVFKWIYSFYVFEQLAILTFFSTPRVPGGCNSAANVNDIDVENDADVEGRTESMSMLH